MSTISPKRPPYTAVRWTFLFKLPGGHRFFKDTKGMIGVADDGIRNPDDTNDGNTLYVVTDEPIVMGREGCAVPVVGIDGESYVILENPGNAIDLAVRLDMKIKASGYIYSLNLIPTPE